MPEELVVQPPELVQEQEAHQSATYLLEVMERCLDKGIVIDGGTSVRVASIELLTLDFHAFVASIERYLDYADAVAQEVHMVDMDEGDHEQLPLP